MSRATVQRTALAVLVICLAALVGSRMLHTDRHEAAHASDHVHVEIDAAAIEAEVALVVH